MSAVEIHSDLEEKDDASLEVTPIHTNLESLESAGGVRLDTDEEEAIVSSTSYMLEKKDRDYTSE